MRPSELPCPVVRKDRRRGELSGGAGLVFKGSGFYLTDYGKNAHRESGTEPASGEGRRRVAERESRRRRSARSRAQSSKPAESKSAELTRVTRIREARSSRESQNSNRADSPTVRKSSESKPSAVEGERIRWVERFDESTDSAVRRPAASSPDK